jgi:mRNA interferase MazF
VNRGDVWWAELPEVGRRPYLILTREVAMPVLTRVLAVPATRNVREIPSEVRLGAGDGMPTDCALSFDNILTVRKAYFTERITRLGVDRMSEVCSALRYATGC